MPVAQNPCCRLGMLRRDPGTAPEAPDGVVHGYVCPLADVVLQRHGGTAAAQQLLL